MADLDAMRSDGALPVSDACALTPSDGSNAVPDMKVISLLPLPPSEVQQIPQNDPPMLRPPIVRHVDREDAAPSPALSPSTSPADATIPPLTPLSAPSFPSNRALLFVKTQTDATPSVQSERSRHLHSRKVTRDIAALDFLQNIPMRSEQLAEQEAPSPATNGRLPSRSRHHSHGDDPTSPLSPSSSLSSPSSSSSSSAHMDGDRADRKRSQMGVPGTSASTPSESLAGRRLPGMDATIVRVPVLFRHRFTTKYPAASAVVRRWEGVTTQQGLLDARLFFSSACGYPIATSTILHYNGNATNAPSGGNSSATAMRRRFASVGNLEAPQSYYDWRGKSYYRLLHATWCPCSRERDSEDAHPEPAPPYLANYLDDPEFRQGRHRHVVRGDKNIGPVVSSILLFVKPNELKEELNKKFQEKHPWLADTGLSLSKIRNLKREALESCQRADLEVATGAIACLLFEKLVLSRYVTRANRKLYMSVCLLLAAKFNEPKGAVAMKSVIRKVLADIDQVHSIPAREVLQAEFMVYAQLSFNLHVLIAEVQPHFTRLLKLIESNPRKYLDDDVFAAYSTLLTLEEQQTAQKAATDGEEEEEEEEEGTDVEGILSDEDDGQSRLSSGRQRSGVDGTDGEDGDDISVFSWNRVSFAHWWSGRRGGLMRQTSTRQEKEEKEAEDSNKEKEKEDGEELTPTPDITEATVL